MRSRLINRRQQGDLGEASAIEWLTRQGATVLIPFGHSPDYDLVADVDGTLLRIQVKTSTYSDASPNGQTRYQVQIATNGGNQSWTGVARRFDPSRADFVFALVGDGRRWWIPTSDIDGETNISLGGSKYSAFEIQPGPPIDSLVYGKENAALESSSDRGSAGVGEPGRSVKSVPSLLSGFDSHLPHSHHSADAGTPIAAHTRVSANHQITIPMRAFEASELAVGDRIRLVVDGPGRVILERIEPASEPLRLLSDGGEVEPL
jgi:bifunctional DNA-binding transcriptional regulator/antitoxin component of YhaV-PrlF toxin-antitoxin module